MREYDACSCLNPIFFIQACLTRQPTRELLATPFRNVANHLKTAQQGLFEALFVLFSTDFEIFDCDELTRSTNVISSTPLFQIPWRKGSNNGRVNYCENDDTGAQYLERSHSGHGSSPLALFSRFHSSGSLSNMLLNSIITLRFPMQ